MSDLEKAEKNLTAFRKATGIWPVGKNPPPNMIFDESQIRAKAYGYWLKAEAEISKLKAENDKLKKFVREFIRVECWGYVPTVDGFDVQDVAEKMGIIVLAQATQEDADRLNGMDDMDIEEGDVFYKWADWMERNRGINHALPKQR